MNQNNNPVEASEQFWSNYEIPFEHGIAIKTVRSGLLRGSNGNGRQANSVNHLHVQEPFTAGRLSRTDGRYLCDRNAAVMPNDEEGTHSHDGTSYLPIVTCQSCLDFMERWEVDEGEQ